MTKEDLRKKRRFEMLQLRRMGATYASIGRKYNITRDRARQICVGEVIREKGMLTRALTRIIRITRFYYTNSVHTL